MSGVLFVPLERVELEVMEIDQQCLLAIDCIRLTPDLQSAMCCVNLRDNSTTMSRWLGVPMEYSQYTKLIACSETVLAYCLLWPP